MLHYEALRLKKVTRGGIWVRGNELWLESQPFWELSKKSGIDVNRFMRDNSKRRKVRKKIVESLSLLACKLHRRQPETPPEFVLHIGSGEAFIPISCSERIFRKKFVFGVLWKLRIKIMLERLWQEERAGLVANKRHSHMNNTIIPALNVRGLCKLNASHC